MSIEPSSEIFELLKDQTPEMVLAILISDMRRNVSTIKSYCAFWNEEEFAQDPQFQLQAREIIQRCALQLGEYLSAGTDYLAQKRRAGS
ncbi:MAG: hypothetical protein SF029_06420 [bacterium]|nr:hypothetical protein [bacterium]